MGVAVFSVVYPGVERFIEDFLRSLSSQTDRGFTLFLINDGVVGLAALLKDKDLKIEVMDRSGPPAKLRKMGIEWSKDSGAKQLIFADADDYLAENRIEVIKRVLGNHDIVVNELMLMGAAFPQPQPMLSKFFNDQMEISQRHIQCRNCMGLTNTAIRIECLPEQINAIPDHMIAFDWALFALSLHGGARAVFTDRTQTYYRQHDRNLASIGSLSDEQILRGVEIKRDHYQFLAEFYSEYDPFAEDFNGLFNQLQNDKALQQKYCQAVKDKQSGISLWWESIKTLKELAL